MGATDHDNHQTQNPRAGRPCHAGPAQRDAEIFDVVNDCDEVVGQATRAEVHARRLLHRAVHVLVFGADGRVFLQQRSKLKDTSPGLWNSSCSGHLDTGEDYDTATVRELQEEIGLAVTADTRLERLVKLTPCRETGWEFAWVYRARSDGPFTLHPAEVETGAWFTVAEVTRALAERPKDFSRAFAYLWPKALTALTKLA
jgi:isopentenyl-diphosphate delta-isomerase type 1